MVGIPHMYEFASTDRDRSARTGAEANATRPSTETGGIVAAWLACMGLWMLLAMVVNVFDGVGVDRAGTQYTPILETMGLSSSASLFGAEALKWIVGLTEFVIAGVCALGVFRPEVRWRCLTIATASLVVLFGGFLSVSFVFKGVGSVSRWTQYPSLIGLFILVFAVLQFLRFGESIARSVAGLSDTLRARQPLDHDLRPFSTTVPSKLELSRRA